MPNLNAPFPISLNWVRSQVGCDYYLWASSLQQFSYQQATGGALNIREHFPNLFSNLNYKVCDLSLGKPATKKPTRDLWSWVWLWLTYDYRNIRYLTAKERKKKQEQRPWPFLWHIQFLFTLLTFEKVTYLKWLPGSVADISDPKNKQSVKWNSHCFNWPICTMAFTKPYIINLPGQK